MNRLKEIRKSIDVSQKYVSEDLGIPQNTLSNYESGNRNPSLVVWQVLADYFDVSVDYLIGKEPMKIEQQIDPPEDEVWGYTLYGEEILVGETDIRETIDGEYMKPDEFERYAYDTSTPVDTEAHRNEFI